MQERRKLLLANSFWMTLGLGIRAIFQAGYFILIARAIGPSEYGGFASFMALVGVLAPFSGWGSGNILVKRTSRNPDLFGKYWGTAIATTLFTSFFLTFAAIMLSKFILPNTYDLWLVLSLSIAELFLARLVYLSAQAFQALEKLEVTAKIYILFSAIRLACAILFIYFPFPQKAQTWSFFYLVSALLSAFPAILWVYREFGGGKLSLRPIFTEIREGFYFSISLSSQGIYNDIDKTLLARLVSTDISGFYAVAYRIIDIAFSPISAMLNATYARFFKHGTKGIQFTKSFAYRLLPWAFLYTIIAGVFIFFSTPIIPLILGKSYLETASILVWLIPILPLKSIHYLAADSLTGAGFQGIRSGLQVTISTINIVLNLWLIPLLGWKGAVIASWVSDGLLSAMLWIIIIHKSNQETVML